MRLWVIFCSVGKMWGPNPLKLYFIGIYAYHAHVYTVNSHKGLGVLQRSLRPYESRDNQYFFGFLRSLRVSVESCGSRLNCGLFVGDWNAMTITSTTALPMYRLYKQQKSHKRMLSAWLLLHGRSYTHIMQQQFTE